MTETTPLFALPLLHVGQAAKELTHNEALILVDALLCARARAIVDDPATISDANAGDLWIVGPAATGDWGGREDQLALFTAGGWRFVRAPAEFGLHVESEGCRAVHRDGWTLAPTVAAPAASANEDSGARATLTEIRDLLAHYGLARPT
jgi:hypothetical protein